MKDGKFKQRLKNISIRWKIFFFLIGFCAILLVLLWLFQVVFLDTFYKHIKINEVKDSANYIIDNIHNDNLEELVEEIALRNDICIKIIFSSGDKYYSEDVVRDCLIHKMPPFDKIKLFLETQENGGELLGYYNRNSFRNDSFNKDKILAPPFDDLQETIIYSKIMTDANGERIILLLNSVISPVNATVSTLQVQLNYITIVMLIFSVILAFIIAQRVSRPIEKINRSAKILATGNYDIKFTGNGYKEIKELSDTLNYASTELSKVDDLRKELIANISHDLRTPLTLISGYAEAMRDLPEENNPENAQIIIDEAKWLTTLVNDVLDLSKIQSGIQDIHPSHFNMTKSIHQVIIRMNELVKNKGYTITYIYDRNVMITADKMRITQAFYNLLVNAINYTGQDKIVVVKQLVTDHKVTIQVIDTGKGISKENLPYIWDRYYKTDKSHTRAVTGTGLGLSIVKSIIEMHNGDYGVTSQTNKGSLFWFSLTYNNHN